MKRLLNLLNHEYPLIIANTALDMYLSREIGRELFERHLFITHSPLSAITCERCLQIHEVLINEAMGNHLYYLCPHTYGGLELVKEEAIRRWRFDLESFLGLVIKQLRIKRRLQMLVPAMLWQLGTVGIAGIDAPVVCLFCRKELPRIIRHLPHDYVTENIAILYLGESHRLKPTYTNVAYLKLNQLLADDATSLHLERPQFMHWLKSAFQHVFFDSRNGDLIIDRQAISNALPSSPQYFFLRCLWEQFDIPVSHEDIFAYCNRELARRAGIAEWNSEYLPSAFCHTMKRLIKQHSSQKTRCDEVIQSTRTQEEQNAYRLTAPRSPRSPPLIVPAISGCQKI